jgi:hypothetical protein
VCLSKYLVLFSKEGLDGGGFSGASCSDDSGG